MDILHIKCFCLFFKGFYGVYTWSEGFCNADVLYYVFYSIHLHVHVVHCVYWSFLCECSFKCFKVFTAALEFNFVFEFLVLWPGKVKLHINLLVFLRYFALRAYRSNICNIQLYCHHTATLHTIICTFSAYMCMYMHVFQFYSFYCSLLSTAVLVRYKLLLPSVSGLKEPVWLKRLFSFIWRSFTCININSLYY